MAALVEVPVERVPLIKQRVAEEAYRVARELLNNMLDSQEIGPVRFRWFTLDRRHARVSIEESVRLSLFGDGALGYLQTSPLDRQLLSKVTHAKGARIQPPVMWLRVTMRTALLAEVVSHEARHLWQNYAYEGDESGMDGDEVDAHRFSAAMRPHFVEIARTVRRESRPAHVKRRRIRQQRSR